VSDAAFDRSADLSHIERRLKRWNRPASPAVIERTYDAALAGLARRLRIVHRPGLPLMRSTMPWRVQKRFFGVWRTQGPYGSRDGLPNRDLAGFFLDLCLRVDARDEAFETLRAS